MKGHVEIGHLTKYDAFRVNRDQVMNLETWFEIHTNASNFLFSLNNTESRMANNCKCDEQILALGKGDITMFPIL